ncbi:hypothetical protein M8J75_001883 [Diaphorina citri]|nr:hypothetical protein M8J75_001883 [Diaphorina citri]
MLTSRFNIPIENISYEHIDRLGNSRETEKELEKIIKILDSGELGYFPDLLEKARDKLRQVNRNHKLVKADPRPVDKLDGLDPDQARAIRNELNDWCSQMKNKESQAMVKEPKTNGRDPSDSTDMSVRGHNILNTNTKLKSSSRIKSCDYEAWDKFDPEVEMKKMDVAIEREKGRIRRNELEKCLNGVDKEDEQQYYTTEEKVSYADAMRVKGNNSYKAGKHQEAIDFYTQSIQLHPTAISYSNRAQVYIKRSQYITALQDCDQALTLDPDFLKAIYRKALALYNLKRKEEAIVWFERFLEKEPNNKMAHDYLTKLYSTVPLKLHLGGQVRNGLKQTPKIIPLDDKEKNLRPKIVPFDDKENNFTPKIVPIEDKATSRGELRTNIVTGKNMKRCEQRNEWGFLKRPCTCTGKPGFIKQYEEDIQNAKKTPSTLVKTSNGNNTHKCASPTNTKTHTGKPQVQQSSVEPKRKYNEFLNASDDFKPNAILDMFSGNTKRVDRCPQIELITSSQKEKDAPRPKIEILNSVEFEE